ncbi:ATP-binding protein [Nocardiopsis sp. NPDC060348]|uniref:ATP-binding protein n=1 Tax=unclassified Nocardiopsis TaxID=2649073 RepID=UPI0036667647
MPRPRRAVEEEWRAPGSGLPRRFPSGGTGTRTAFFGSQPSQAAQIRSWCQRGVRLPAHRAFPVLLVVSELVANAWRHSASGAECGRVRVQMRHLLERVLLVAVTDDGPRPGQPLHVPRLASEADALTTCGRGLRLVDRLSVEWGWDGEPGRPLTVWAHINPYAPVPETVEA